MKIILSRKGLDSQYGGIPSPIIYHGHGYKKFYPIPIPEKNSNVRYSDLSLYDDHKVSTFLDHNPLKSMNYATCHLDPDIRQSYLPDRPQGWRRAFGQAHIAQDHLRAHSVGVGDLFLFFGWFKFAEWDGKRFNYVATDDNRNGFHAIYGYLQVGEVIRLHEDDPIPKWLERHPHVGFKSLDAYKGKSNVIYVANKFFQHGDKTYEKDGSALFTFAEDLILTKKGSEKRTAWELPAIFHPDNGVKVTYNPAKNWEKNDGSAFLRSAYRGQEFVVAEDPQKEIEDWGVNLVMKHTVTD